MDTTIEVKGNQSTVTVCWDKNEGEDVDEKDKTIDESGQMMDSGKNVLFCVLFSKDIIGTFNDLCNK